MKVIVCITLVILLHYRTSYGVYYNQTLRKCFKYGVDHHSKHQKFLTFVRKYDKHYKSSGECIRRFKMFCKALHQVKRLQKSEKGSAIYGTTFLSDIKQNEWKLYTGIKDSEYKGGRIRERYKKIPSAWDWRHKGVLNPVRNQGRCGSSYAFALIANIESVYAIKKEKLYHLSEQQILDCGAGIKGCSNGNVTSISEYLTQYGVMRSSSYPYMAKQGHCNFKKASVVIRPKKFVVLAGDERYMAQYLYEHGPVCVVISAYCLGRYKRGIIFSEKCSSELNHLVLLVGYGVGLGKKGKRLPYWVVQNSWGPEWGEEGYFRIARNRGLAGIKHMAISASFN